MRPALCVRIKRKDGKILRTTSHDTDLEVTAVGYEGTYRSAAAVAPSEMQFRPTLAVDGMDLEGILSEATGITEHDIANGIYDQSRVTVFEVADITNLAGVREWAWGVMGKKARTEEGRLRMEVRSISALMNQNQGEVWQSRCRAELGAGDEANVLRRCGVDLADSDSPYVFDEEVTGVLQARKSFVVATLTQDAGYFSKGKVTFLSGANAGAVREIRIHESGGIMSLYDPLPFDVVAGDDVRVEAGCDKTFATCRDKFDNAVNFQGEPYIPGPTYMTRNTSTPGSVKYGSQSLLGSLVQLAATAIGAFFGPIGAFVGSLIGAALAPTPGGSQTGPRAADLRITSSSEGTRVPYVAGRYAVSGNVLTDIELIEVKETRRVGRSLFSSGTRITEYKYFFTGFVGLGEGEMDVLRIWAYGSLIYDARPVEEREAEFIERAGRLNFTFLGITFTLAENLNDNLLEHMTVYRGTEDQAPDPVLVEHYGAGNVPSFKGRAGLMFNLLPLEQFGQGAVPPQLLVEVCRPLPEIPAPEADDENVGEDVL
jgi:uncharacterized phage protein (TIGR02218 family)